MSNSIKPMTMLTGAGSIIGGAIGGFFGGLPGVEAGAKIGGALGVQTAIVSKGEDGIDAAGRKINALVDKTGGAIDKVGDVTVSAIEKVADVWSKMFLCGYATTIAFNGANLSSLNYNQFCKGALESVNCLSMSLTTVSFNAFAFACGAALVREIYFLTKRN